MHRPPWSHGCDGRESAEVRAATPVVLFRCGHGHLPPAPECCRVHVGATVRSFQDAVVTRGSPRSP
eukprot:7197759-Lingulodinium_polyedra.AAC.1